VNEDETLVVPRPARWTSASDPDDDSLTASGQRPGHGTLTLNSDGSYSYTPGV